MTSWRPQSIPVRVSRLQQLPRVLQSTHLLSQAWGMLLLMRHVQRGASSRRSPTDASRAAQQTVTLASGQLAPCPSADKAGGLFKRDFCLVAPAGGEETGKLARSEKERTQSVESSPASPGS